MPDHLNAVVLIEPGKIMLMRSILTASFSMLLGGMWLPTPCAVIHAFRSMTWMRAAGRPPTGRTWLVAAISALLCAACSTSGGWPRPTPPSVALRPLDTNLPIPLLVWHYKPVEYVGDYREFLFAAYDDGRIIFRAPRDGVYRALTDTALVRRLYGSAGERSAYRALRDVRMPPEWGALDGGTETVCLWTGGEMRCHHLDNLMREYVGRPEACAGAVRDSTSFRGRACRTHATLPVPFATYYRRIYDAVQERADAAAPWPGPVLLTVEEVGCTREMRTPWPEDVPHPRERERGEARRLTITAEQARRLSAVDRADYRDCLVADGAAWVWSAYFELPNLGVKWPWQG
jgi:hypothetical protein